MLHNNKGVSCIFAATPLTFIDMVKIEKCNEEGSFTDSAGDTVYFNR
jgi:hypothetical protein